MRPLQRLDTGGGVLERITGSPAEEEAVGIDTSVGVCQDQYRPDGAGNADGDLGTGFYLYRIRSGNFEDVKRATLIK